MKKILFLSFAVLMAVMASAKPVDPDHAVQVAKNFVAQYVKGADQYTVSLAYTHPMPESKRDAIYAFNVNNAFVLVSADDVAHPVLGYNLSRPWPITTKGGCVILPSQVSGYLDELAAQIEAAVIQQGEPDRETAAEWHQLTTEHLTLTTNLPDSVGPLLTTTWDQGQYYNALCPEDAAGPDGHAVTGCVATAMAQIINYWGYPIHGRGKQRYDSHYGVFVYDDNTGNYVHAPNILMVDFDSNIYDYANMPSSLSRTSTPAQVNAVAKLIYHCGVATNMRYGATGSDAIGTNARAALVNNFMFKPSLNYAEKNHMRNRDWIDIIKNNIMLMHPVLYAGSGDAGGHMFVCDGYSDDYLHFNFGWSGFFDGWYLSSAIEPTVGYEFNSSQSIILDIVPDSTGEKTTLYSQYQWGQQNYFTIAEPTHLKNLLADNEYIYDGNSPYDSGHIFTFTPSDTSKQILVYVMDDVMLDVKFYDGTTTDSLIRSFENDGGYYHHIDTSPIRSSQHSMTIVVQSNSLIKGIHLLITEDNDCDMVTGLHSTADSNFIHLTWDTNSNCNNWQVEYGPRGFQHGNGTLLTINTNSIYIGDLNPTITYDFYVRPLCNSATYGPWSIPEQTSLKRRYWLDVVTTQPEGYYEDANGNITISSAEGLAWMARMSNYSYNYYPEDFSGRTVTLVSDINLGQYLWSPINCFKGIFDGAGHIIDSLTSTDDDFHLAGGVIGFLKNAVVKNVMVRNCDISSQYTYLAGVVLDADSSLIFNCCFQGKISNNGLGGSGICYEAKSTTIINCVAIGQIASNGYTAGICSKISRGRILNCYSSVSLIPRTPHLTYGICANNPQSEVSNCYSNYYLSGYYPVSSMTYESMRTDLSYFIEVENQWVLGNPMYGNVATDSIAFEDGFYSSLVDVMNKGIEKYNIQGLRLWKIDTSGTYGGLPMLSDTEYSVVCPNISSVTLRNIKVGNDLGLEISVGDSVEVDYYEVQYGKLESEALHMVDTTKYAIIHNNPDTLWGLNQGSNYLIKVRPVCDSNHHGAWSDEISIVFDIPYWTDVVTEQPDGYIVDEQGNISIYSAEGLAWLSSVVNGCNGQDRDDLSGKIISLLSDVNIGGYKWRSLLGFSGIFDGNNHTIDSLYVNENTDSVGFFATIHNGEAKRTNFTHAMIRGHKYVGTICGYGIDVKLSDCYVNCEVNAYSHGGGLVGTINGVQISNSGTKGNIVVEFEYAGGLAGWLGLSEAGTFGCFIRNSFSNCNVVASSIAGILGGLLSDIQLFNCYVNGTLSAGFWSGGIAGSNVRLAMSNCYTTMYIPDEIGYLIDGHAPIGIISGYNYSITANHTYFPNGSNVPLVGTNYTLYDHGSIIFSDTVSYLLDSIKTFTHSVSIGNTCHNNLLTSLNAWVDEFDTLGTCFYWTADTSNENGGFPVFGEKHCVTSYTLDTIVVCNHYTWHDSVFYSSAVFMDTLANIYGCDSIVSLHLTINTPVPTATTEVACDSYTWQGAPLTASGDYTHPHNDANSCTQVDTLHLTINHSTSATETVTECESYFFGGQWIYASGQYADTLTNTANCDSIVSLNLTINTPVPTATTEVACDSYTWQGATLTVSGTYTHPHNDANGCTQVDTLHLTINHSTTATETVTECESFFFGGQWLYASGQYADTLTNAANCDSVVTLQLTINNPVHIATIEVACDSYTWQGVPFTASGTYTHPHNDANGCTQVDTLHLTINHSTTGDTTAVACDNFSWWGTNYTISTTSATHTLTNAAGCDSVVTLNLTLNYSTTTSVTDTAENSYTWNGTTYTESGTYQWQGVTTEDCDSTVTLILVINHVGIETIDGLNVRVYPNPTAGWLTVDAEDILSVELFDLSGRKLATHERTKHIDLRGLPAGAYLLKIHLPVGTSLQRVILK